MFFLTENEIWIISQGSMQQHVIIAYNSATAFLVNIPGMETNFWSSFLSLVISLHNWMSSILTNKGTNEEKIYVIDYFLFILTIISFFL